jgi:hypothetical protein
MLDYPGEATDNGPNGGYDMEGIVILHCERERGFAEGLRGRLAELAVPELGDFVSLSSVVSPQPLRAEMTAAGAVIVLLSGEARRDSRVMTETGLAVSLGKPLIAVILDDTKPEDFDFIEAGAWILSGGSQSLDQLARELHATLTQKGTHY